MDPQHGDIGFDRERIGIVFHCHAEFIIELNRIRICVSDVIAMDYARIPLAGKVFQSD